MSKLAHLPIALFTSVMGFSGLSLAWLKASQLGWPFTYAVGHTARIFTSILLILLLSAYFLKALLHWQNVRQEALNPIKINFFAAIPIGIILVSTLWSDSYPIIANWIWSAGVLLMLVATLTTMSSWINQARYQVNHLNPAWFIPVVGNILIPIAGVRFGHLQTSWFFFSVGLFFWIILTAIVMNRLFVHEALAPRMRPTLFILLAPPSVGFISYLSLTGSVLDTTAKIIFFIGLFLLLLLAINAVGFLKLPFFLSGWAYSFPIAGMSVASFEMGQLTNLYGYIALGWALLAVLSVIVFYLAYKTAGALITGDLLAPEPVLP